MNEVYAEFFGEAKPARTTVAWRRCRCRAQGGNRRHRLQAGVARYAASAELLRPMLREFPALTIAIEGHRDERGSAEYNLGLEDRRAMQAADFLDRLGLARADNYVTMVK